MDSVIDTVVSHGLCTVEAKQHFEGSALFVVVILCAHGSPSFEKSYIQLLRALIDTTQIKDIFVEGASEKLDPVYLQWFPDRQSNLLLCASLLLKGELNGVEYMLMSGHPQLNAWGIEEAPVYRKMYEILKDVLRNRLKWDVLLSNIMDRLASVQQQNTLHHDLSLVQRLLAAQCTTADSLDIASADLDSFSLCRRITEILPASAECRSFVGMQKEFGDAIVRAMQFYDILVARTNIMAKKAISKMREIGIDKAFFATGGAHDHGVRAVFTAARVSYVVLRPTFIPDRFDDARYRNSMLQISSKKANFTIEFEGDAYYASDGNRLLENENLTPEEVPESTRDDAVAFVKEMGDWVDIRQDTKINIPFESPEQSVQHNHAGTISAINTLARHLESMDAFDKAESLYREALNRAPDDIVVLGNYAFFCQNFRRDFSAACELYQHALAVDPNDSINQTNFAGLCLVMENFAEAEYHLREALRLGAGQVDRYTARTLFLRAALAAVRNENFVFYLGQLKSIFDQGIRTHPSRNTSVCEYIQQHLTAQQFAILDAIYIAINEPDGLAKLNVLSTWQAIRPVPLDMHWP